MASSMTKTEPGPIEVSLWLDKMWAWDV
jgi:hypothetical protein